MDTDCSRLTAQRRSIIERWFPLLDANNYSFTSCATDDYNCAAWAARDNTTNWWPISPDILPEYYWPEGALRDESLDAFVDGYSRIGFEVCDNADLEQGVEKIAVYASYSGDPKHVALQLANGRWTSKLGCDEDIEHNSLRDLQGGRYGYPALFMKRPRTRG